MKAKLRLQALPLLAAAALLAPAASAGEGRIPVWDVTTISSPGHYMVTRDISAPSPITITAPDVVLDLGGHTVTATLVGASVPVTINVPGSGAGTVVVRNGQLRGGVYSVLYQGDPATRRIRLRFEDLDITTPGQYGIVIDGAPVVEILRCAVHESPNATAVAVSSDAGFTGSFRGNVIADVGTSGFELYGIEGGEIRDNLITRFATAGGNGMGILVSQATATSGGVRVENNTIRNGLPQSTGIVISYNMHHSAVIGNVIESVTRGILVYSNGTRISGNTVGGTTQSGIEVAASDCGIDRNLVESGSGDGVRINGFNDLLDTNTIQGHFGYGIAFQGGFDHAWRGNMLRNNVSGAVSGAAAATDAGGNIP